MPQHHAFRNYAIYVRNSWYYVWRRSTFLINKCILYGKIARFLGRRWFLHTHCFRSEIEWNFDTSIRLKFEVVIDSICKMLWPLFLENNDLKLFECHWSHRHLQVFSKNLNLIKFMIPCFAILNLEKIINLFVRLFFVWCACNLSSPKLYAFTRCHLHVFTFSHSLLQSHKLDPFSFPTFCLTKYNKNSNFCY